MTAAPQPESQRVAADIRARIRSGALPPGALLPSEREFMAAYSIGKSTVAKVMSLLRAEGLIESQRGRGTFVRRTPPVRRIAMDRYRADLTATADQPQTSFTNDQGIDWSQYRLDRDYAQVEADDDLAAMLDVAPGAALLRRHFVFYASGEPSQISTNYLPLSLVDDTPVTDPENEPWPGGTLAQAAYLGHPITRVEESVTARMPTTEESETLRMIPGTPVQTIRRRLIAEDVVVEVCRDIVLPSDQVVLDYAIDL